ncbi:hypothetical protein KY345_04815 [Candidatus Woesearchaeota archaeon]|nr:hypothetical protein [Candidatus Woesearchaeota archaeon]
MDVKGLVNHVLSDDSRVRDTAQWHGLNDHIGYVNGTYAHLVDSLAMNARGELIVGCNDLQVPLGSAEVTSCIEERLQLNPHFSFSLLTNWQRYTDSLERLFNRPGSSLYQTGMIFDESFVIADGEMVAVIKEENKKVRFYFRTDKAEKYLKRFRDYSRILEKESVR